MKEEIVERTKEPKKKKGLIKFITFLVMVGVIVLSLGFVFPGLLWTKSLGIKYTKEDYQSVMNKLNYVKDAAPTGSSKDEYDYIYGETTDINVEFTSEELTAFFNEGRPDYYAVKNVQIRVNADGTIEAVGSANVDYFLNEILGGKYSREEIKNEIPALGLLPKNVNLYLNVSGSVINNKSSINMNSVSVQGVPIPSTYVKSGEAVGTVTEGLDNVIAKGKTNSGLDVEKIVVENGKIVFKGKVPTSLKRVER